MLKNILATVGMATITKLGLDLFIRYYAMKSENEHWRATSGGAKKPGDAGVGD